MVEVAQLGPAVNVRPVFSAERVELLTLLASLGRDEWLVPTVCSGWAVRHVVLHLLHDDLRRLSRTRDGYLGGPSPIPGQTLPDFLNIANQRWVSEADFLSPDLLVDLLSHSSSALKTMWAQADLDAVGEGVWWAGIARAPVWLDLARDYTEDWTHHQQIREALDKPGLNDPGYQDPVLDTVLRAAPHTYRQITAATGSTVQIDVDSAGRTLSWTLRAEPNGWFLDAGNTTQPTAQVSMPAETLWRLATGGMSTATAHASVAIRGAGQLAEPFLAIVAVVR